MEIFLVQKILVSQKMRDKGIRSKLSLKFRVLIQQRFNETLFSTNRPQQPQNLFIT